MRTRRVGSSEIEEIWVGKEDWPAVRRAEGGWVEVKG